MSWTWPKDPTPAEAKAWNNLTGAYAVPTYRNTAFVDWWLLLNTALKARGQPEAAYREAKEAWAMGVDPVSAAIELDR